VEGPEKREKKRAARGMSRDREEEGGGGDKVAISRGISQRKVQGKIYDGG